MATLFAAAQALVAYDIVVGLGADNMVGFNTPSSFTTSDADILMSNGTALAVATEPGATPLSGGSGKGRAALHAFAVRYKALGFKDTDHAILLVNCGREDTRLDVEWNASGTAYTDCATLYTNTLSLLSGGTTFSLVAILVQLGEHEGNRTTVKDTAVALQSLVSRVRAWSGANYTTAVVTTALPSNFTGVKPYLLATSRVYENAGYLFPFAASVAPQPTHGLSGGVRLDDAAQQDMGYLLAELLIVARNRTLPLFIRSAISGWVNHWTFDDTFNDTISGVVAVAADASDFSARMETNSGRSRFGKVYHHPDGNCVGLRLAAAPPNITIAMWHITPSISATRFVSGCDPNAPGQCTAFLSGYGEEQIRFSPSHGGLLPYVPFHQPAIGDWFFVAGSAYGMNSQTYSYSGVDGVFGYSPDEDVEYADSFGQFAGNSGMVLGASQTNPGAYCDYDGVSDDFMVFDRILTPVEMVALYLQTHQDIVIDQGPTPQPTQAPTEAPTADPTLEPSARPSSTPTRRPSAIPTARPSRPPTAAPSGVPTAGPTVVPGSPSPDPTVAPSAAPTTAPSAVPTQDPTAAPSSVPTVDPTPVPSAQPSAQPSAEPTTPPSARPSAVPTTQPSAEPTLTPSAAPSATPSAVPSAEPTLTPSAAPSASPTTAPTRTTCSDGQGPVNDTACGACSPGTYSAAATNFTCANCSMGKFASLGGQAFCFSCIVFRYQPTVGQTSCLPCDAGWYTPQTGSSTCVECTAGLFTGGPGQEPPYDTNCEGCPAGKYSLNGASACTVCESGRYAPSGNSSSCFECAGVSTNTSCTPTPAPTAAPSSSPSATPTSEPTAAPSAAPSVAPTAQPSAEPTAQPSAEPTAQPSAVPTATPTTASPTATPSSHPSAAPSIGPTSLPTAGPTPAPTRSSLVIEQVCTTLSISTPVALVSRDLFERGLWVNVTPTTSSPCVDVEGWDTRERFDLRRNAGFVEPFGVSKAFRMRMVRLEPAPDDVWYRYGAGLYVCNETSGLWVPSYVYNCSEYDDVRESTYRREWLIETSLCHNSPFVFRVPVVSADCLRFARLCSGCVKEQYGCNCEYRSGSVFTSSFVTVVTVAVAVLCWTIAEIAQLEAEGYPLRGAVARTLRRKRNDDMDNGAGQHVRLTGDVPAVVLLGSFAPVPGSFAPVPGILPSQFVVCLSFRAAATAALCVRLYAIGENQWYTRARGPEMVRLAMVILVGVECAVATVRLVLVHVQRRGPGITRRMTWFLLFATGSCIQRMLVLFPFLSVVDRMRAVDSYSTHWIAGVMFVGSTCVLRVLVSLWMASADPSKSYMTVFGCTRFLQVESTLISLVWFLLWLLLPCE